MDFISKYQGNLKKLFHNDLVVDVIIFFSFVIIRFAFNFYTTFLMKNMFQSLIKYILILRFFCLKF